MNEVWATAFEDLVTPRPTPRPRHVLHGFVHILTAQVAAVGLHEPRMNSWDCFGFLDDAVWHESVAEILRGL